MRIIPRLSPKRLGILFIAVVVFLCWCWWAMIRMPLASYHGTLPPISTEQAALRDELRVYVQKLAGEIGMRHASAPGSMKKTADYLHAEFSKTGHSLKLQNYSDTYEADQVTFYNVEVEIRGHTTPDEIVVIGAHYDSQRSGPGADDNASGVAAILSLAHFPALQRPGRTLRFVAFANEEYPFSISSRMGSYVYAQKCRERGEKIVAMISVESIGYYSTNENSQTYPFPFSLIYPSKGDFIGFVSRTTDGDLLRRCLEVFRRKTQFPSEGGAPPSLVRGVSLSDHWSFWKAGYPAIMITDTTRNRSPYFHKKTDTPETLDYDSMARVVEGLGHVIEDLVNR